MRLIVLFAAAAAMLLVAASASATIHPIVPELCTGSVDDPPGQTPGETHSDQSTLRAVQETILATGTPNFDHPASKWEGFHDPDEDFAAHAHCQSP